MDFTIITAENFKTNNWSGGKTTQLFIYPSTAEYQQLDFNFRLSTAKVENEKSVFTSLPGVSRKLMILDGEIIINHENHYTKHLSKFEMDAFEGDWKTTAVGKCTDFNLMTTGKTTGELAAVSVEKNQFTFYNINNAWQWLLIYVFCGKVNVFIDTISHALIKDNLLVINKLETLSLKIEGVENSELIFSKITHFETY